MPGKYTLDDQGNPVLEHDLMKWAAWLEKSDRIIAKDMIDDVRVSTVFLGLDHSFGDGPPLLFETMIFGGEHDQYQERYPNRDAAFAGHDRAMALVRDSAVTL